MMNNIHPLDIVTSTGTRFRTYAHVAASLAAVKKSLIKDGIIDADDKFQIQGTVISPASEEQMKLTDIPLEIQIYRNDTPPSSTTSHGHSGSSDAGNSSGEPLTLVPLHRLYYPSPSNHFYTTDDVERDACIKDGYGLEPTAGLILLTPSPAEDSIPLCRIRLANEHLYTTNVEEKERTISQAGTKDEGIVGYVYGEQRIGTLPLYRLYSHRWNDHLYTASAGEKELCIAGDWTDEGIACYIYA